MRDDSILLPMPALIYALALPVDADEFEPRPVVIQSFERTGDLVTLHHDAPADALLALYVSERPDNAKPPTFAGMPVYPTRLMAEAALKRMYRNTRRAQVRLAAADPVLLDAPKPTTLERIP
jgi:hypothetical protein